jgi:hypothetical protein
MLLPTRSNRALLRSFWIVMSLGSGMLAGAVAWLVADVPFASSLRAGGAVALIIVLPGTLFPHSVATPYRAWNWIVRRFCALAVRYLTAVCFRTVGLASSVGAAPDRFESTHSGGSGWRGRSTQPREAYRCEDIEPFPGLSGSGFRSVQAWMRDSGPRLSWTLLPFLALIRWLDTGSVEQEAPSTNIYTLY